MTGGSADSLSLNPRVRLWCGIKEWQGSTASSGVLSSRTTKKPNDYMIMTTLPKEKPPFLKGRFMRIVNMMKGASLPFSKGGLEGM